MEQLLEIFKPEGVWGTIATAIAAIIPYVATYVNEGKPFKSVKEKTSRDKFCLLLYRMLAFYAVYVVLSIFLVVMLTKIGYNENNQRIGSIILCVFFGIVFSIYEKKNEEKIEIKECISGRWKIFLEIVVVVIPVFLATMLAILYIAVPKWRIFRCVEFGTVFLLLMYLIFAVCLLDGKKQYKYRRATIYLKNNVEIQGVDVETICRKGGWVIANNATDHSEIRFRNRDIERIKYTDN